jgi:hypothetical protein
VPEELLDGDQVATLLQQQRGETYAAACAGLLRGDLRPRWRTSRKTQTSPFFSSLRPPRPVSRCSWSPSGLNSSQSAIAPAASGASGIDRPLPPLPGCTFSQRDCKSKSESFRSASSCRRSPQNSSPAIMARLRKRIHAQRSSSAARRTLPSQTTRWSLRPVSALPPIPDNQPVTRISTPTTPTLIDNPNPQPYILSWQSQSSQSKRKGFLNAAILGPIPPNRISG